MRVVPWCDGENPLRCCKSTHWVAIDSMSKGPSSVWVKGSFGCWRKTHCMVLWWCKQLAPLALKWAPLVALYWPLPIGPTRSTSFGIFEGNIFVAPQSWKLKKPKYCKNFKILHNAKSFKRHRNREKWKYLRGLSHRFSLREETWSLAQFLQIMLIFITQKLGWLETVYIVYSEPLEQGWFTSLMVHKATENSVFWGFHELGEFLGRNLVELLHIS